MEKRRLSKRRVMNGTIRKTAGGLEKRDITVRRSKDRQGSRRFAGLGGTPEGRWNQWSVVLGVADWRRRPTTTLGQTPSLRWVWICVPAREMRRPVSAHEEQRRSLAARSRRRR